MTELGQMPGDARKRITDSPPPTREPIRLTDEEREQIDNELRGLWRELAEKRIEQGVDWPRIVLTLFGDIDALTARLAPGTAYVVPDGPKELRETLCVAQAQIGNSFSGASRKREHIDRLQRLIDECDRHRPIGSDGKHEDRHTPTCGCEDKAEVSA